MNEFVSIKQAANALKMSDPAVRRLVRQGYIKKAPKGLHPITLVNKEDVIRQSTIREQLASNQINITA